MIGRRKHRDVPHKSNSNCQEGETQLLWVCLCFYPQVHTRHFSHFQLFVTLWTLAHQAPLSMEFSQQEYWSGLPFLLQGTFPTQGTKPHLLCLLHCRQILFILLINTLFASLLSMFMEVFFCKAEGLGPLSLTTGLVARIWCFNHHNLALISGWKPKTHFKQLQAKSTWDDPRHHYPAVCKNNIKIHFSKYIYVSGTCI